MFDVFPIARNTPGDGGKILSARAGGFLFKFLLPIRFGPLMLGSSQMGLINPCPNQRTGKVKI
jgi:hypothetical protein